MNPPIDDPFEVAHQREDDVLERIAEILEGAIALKENRYIGDDAAVVAAIVGETLISTDVAVWGVHLDDKIFSLDDLGYKALTSAISDIAAMGGFPKAAVIAVSSPPGSDLDQLHRGIARAAQATGCPVVGGDLTSATQLSVAVTVVGECPGGGAVRRNGARPGETLVVTGPLGRSAAGYRRARDGWALSDELVLAHRHPWPRIAEGQAARGAGASAMMDLSDGIGLDLHRLADASGVGFVLRQIPVADGATIEEALSGGEDYELLICTPDPDRLALIFADRGLREPIVIGSVVADVSLRTWENEPLPRRGWQHDL